MSVRDLLRIAETATDRRSVDPPPKAAGEPGYRDALRKSIAGESSRPSSETPSPKQRTADAAPPAEPPSDEKPQSPDASPEAHGLEDERRSQPSAKRLPMPAETSPPPESTESATAGEGAVPASPAVADEVPEDSDVPSPPSLQPFPPSAEAELLPNGDEPAAELPTDEPESGIAKSDAMAGEPPDADEPPDDELPSAGVTAPPADDHGSPAATGDSVRGVVEGGPPAGLRLFDASESDGGRSGSRRDQPGEAALRTTSTDVAIDASGEDSAAPADRVPKPPAGLFADGSDPVTPTVVLAAADARPANSGAKGGAQSADDGPAAQPPATPTPSDAPRAPEVQTAGNAEIPDGLMPPTNDAAPPRFGAFGEARNAGTTSTNPSADAVVTRHAATQGAEVEAVARAAAADVSVVKGVIEDTTATPVETVPSGRGAAETSRPTTAANVAHPVADERAAENVERVLQGVRLASSSGRALRVRLDPPELGAVRIEVSLQDGHLVARLEVETASARSTILDRIATLTDQLVQQGHPVERVDVQLSDPAGRHTAGDEESGRERSSPRERERERNPHGDREEPADDDEPGLMDEIDVEV